MKIFYSLSFSLNSKCLRRSELVMVAYLSFPSSEHDTWYMVDTQQLLIQIKSNEKNRLEIHRQIAFLDKLYLDLWQQGFQKANKERIFQSTISSQMATGQRKGRKFNWYNLVPLDTKSPEKLERIGFLIKQKHLQNEMATNI